MESGSITRSAVDLVHMETAKRSPFRQQWLTGFSTNRFRDGANALLEYAGLTEGSKLFQSVAGALAVNLKAQFYRLLYDPESRD
jgi:hypothetical protein